MRPAELEVIARDVASMVKEKNRGYGSAFQKVSHILSILFPNGIPTNKYHDVAILSECLTRFAELLLQMTRM